MNLTIRCSSANIEPDRNGVSIDMYNVNENDLDNTDVAKCISDKNLDVSLDKVLGDYSIDDVLSKYSTQDILDYLGEAVIISEARKYKINNLE